MMTQANHKTTLLGFEPSKRHDSAKGSYFEPVNFSPEGLEAFFTHQYNTRQYTQAFLPCCFVHVLDFLSHAHTTRDPHTFAIASLDTFHQRLKDTTWVNPYALSQLLEHLPGYIAPLCKDQDAQQAYQSILHHAILYDFDTLKQDPQAFLKKTADAIYDINASRETIREVQQRTIRCIESALDKLIFSPSEQFDTWRVFITLGHQLEKLYEHNIIPDETYLNHMLWSLTYRYSHFLEQAGAYLAIETYNEIRSSLAHDEASFLEWEEIEVYMTDKQTHLLQALSQGYAQSRVRQQYVT